MSSFATVRNCIPDGLSSAYSSRPSDTLVTERSFEPATSHNRTVLPPAVMTILWSALRRYAVNFSCGSGSVSGRSVRLSQTRTASSAVCVTKAAPSGVNGVPVMGHSPETVPTSSNGSAGAGAVAGPAARVTPPKARHTAMATPTAVAKTKALEVVS